MIEFRLSKHNNMLTCCLQLENGMYVASLSNVVIELTDDINSALKFHDENDAWGLAYELHYRLDEWVKVVEL